MKLQDIEFPKGTHPTFWEFYDQTQRIFNNSRYQLRKVSEIPTWTGDQGEIILVDDGSTKTIYAYSDGWVPTTLVMENRTDDPVSPTTGQIWYRTDL